MHFYCFFCSTEKLMDHNKRPNQLNAMFRAREPLLWTFECKMHVVIFFCTKFVALCKKMCCDNNGVLALLWDLGAALLVGGTKLQKNAFRQYNKNLLMSREIVLKNTTKNTIFRLKVNTIEEELGNATDQRQRNHWELFISLPLLAPINIWQLNVNEEKLLLEVCDQPNKCCHCTKICWTSFQWGMNVFFKSVVSSWLVEP